jgi:hypothetical protein
LNTILPLDRHGVVAANPYLSRTVSIGAGSGKLEEVQTMAGPPLPTCTYRRYMAV